MLVSCACTVATLSCTQEVYGPLRAGLLARKHLTDASHPFGLALSSLHALSSPCTV